MYSPHAFSSYTAQTYSHQPYSSQDYHQLASSSFQTYYDYPDPLELGQPSPTQPITSSLAHALDEQVALAQSAQQFPGFLDSEVVPYPPFSSAQTSLREAYPYQAAGEPSQHSAPSPAGGFGDVMSDDEGYHYGYPYEDYQVASPSCESPSDTACTPSPTYDDQAELGYLNGHVVPLGLVREGYSTDDQMATCLTPPLDTYQALPSPHVAPLDIPTQHPAFQFTRSYTLAEAITPIEDQHPRLDRSLNNSPEASSLPTTSPVVGSDASASALVDPSYLSGRPISSSPPPRSHNEPSPHAQSPSSLGPTGPATSAPTHRAAPSHKSSGETVGRPGEGVIKLDVNVPREPKKKPLMACLFCRERKIACGHPSPDDKDRRCNQCKRRDLVCEFPKECRRGQHKRTPRLARVNAIVNGEPLPDDDILIIQQPQYPLPSMSSSSTSAYASSSAPKAKAKLAVLPSKERRKNKPAKGLDIQQAAERRATARLQRQIADQQHRHRLSQQQRALVASPSAA